MQQKDATDRLDVYQVAVVSIEGGEKGDGQAAGRECSQ